MAHVDIAAINQWLNESRLVVTSVDAAKETTAFDIVASRLAPRYDVATWVDQNTTPSMVRSIIGMLIAAWIYNAAHAENENSVDGYGDHLESSAMSLLGRLAEGSDIIPGAIVDTDASSGSPVFFPTTVATQLAVDEGPEADGAAVRAFTMGHVF